MQERISSVTTLGSARVRRSAVAAGAGNARRASRGSRTWRCEAAEVQERTSPTTKLGSARARNGRGAAVHSRVAIRVKSCGQSWSPTFYPYSARSARSGWRCWRPILARRASRPCDRGRRSWSPMSLATTLGIEERQSGSVAPWPNPDLPLDAASATILESARREVRRGAPKTRPGQAWR